MALKLNVGQIIENPLFVFIINEFMVLQTSIPHLPLLKSSTADFVLRETFPANEMVFKWRVFIKKVFRFRMSDFEYLIFQPVKKRITLTANG